MWTNCTKFNMTFCIDLNSYTKDKNKHKDKDSWLYIEKLSKLWILCIWVYIFVCDKMHHYDFFFSKGRNKREINMQHAPVCSHLDFMLWCSRESSTGLVWHYGAETEQRPTGACVLWASRLVQRYTPGTRAVQWVGAGLWWILSTSYCQCVPSIHVIDTDI